MFLPLKGKHRTGNGKERERAREPNLLSGNGQDRKGKEMLGEGGEGNERRINAMTRKAKTGKARSGKAEIESQCTFSPRTREIMKEKSWKGMRNE